MICISAMFLRKIGFDQDHIDRMPAAGDGLCISPLFSFGGGGFGGVDRDALKTEPEPRSLLLVGMADRYGEATPLVAGKPREICVDKTFAPSQPSHAEAVELRDALARCSHPSAEAIRAKLIPYTATDRSEGFREV